MTLTVGTRLGPYEILAPIGSGGMGEVYRARDTRLQRDVAVKVIPAAMADDGERLARFEREAQVVASLNHPNIAAAYGLEEAGATKALVLELVPGPTLAERLVQGPLALDEAIGIARQVAEGLEAAHERGVVHRDLKPANIKIAAGGQVKVIDFGIAKALAAVEEAAALDDSPTYLFPPTQAGMLLGTASYMAPEQVRGLAADKRADIWAFGCVLYEMLTGRRLFEGPTTADVLAAVLHAPVDLAALPAGTPDRLRRLIARCLERDVRNRLRDIGEARIELESLAVPARPSVAAVNAAVPAVRLRRAGSWWGLIGVVLAVVLLLASAGTYWLVGRATHDGPTAVGPGLVTFAVLPPTGREEVGDGTDFNPDFALSPDGRAIAFTTEDPTGQRDIWVRRLSSLAAERVPGTDGGQRPFWSPDGLSLGFFANHAINRVALSGGPVQVVCSVADMFRPHATWGASGVILFPTPEGIAAVQASGGQPSIVTKLDARTERSRHDPVFLPDGRHFLFLSSTIDASRRAVYLGSLDGPAPIPLIHTVARAEYLSPGYLAYVRGRSLVAQPLDVARGRLSGDPVVLVPEMAVEPIPGHACYCTAPAGVIAYRTVDRNVVSQLRWVDRTGRLVETPWAQGADVDVSLSRDGRVAAVSRISAGVETEARPPTNIWFLDLARQLSTRWTLQSSEGDEAPTWSPDGSQLVFAAHSTPDAPAEVRLQRANAIGGARVLASGPQNLHPVDWSPDGRVILLHGGRPDSEELGLWVLPVEGGVPQRIGSANWEESQGRFSPDGRWIAYVSEESGRREVYVRPFPAASDVRWQISSNGGGQPQWRRDGREIEYVAPDGTVTAVPISFAGGAAVPGRPVALFREPSLRMNNAPFFYGGASGYAVSPDGSRFLVNRMLHEPRPDAITIVLNALPGR